MILFIAPNPHKAKQREGFLQRVYTVDRLFEDQEKVYFEDLKPREQAEALISADIIYVHSVYNANTILRLYPLYAHKIITDLHGVVPEEEELAQNYEMQAVMAYAEKEMFKHGKYFVAVSDAMVDHFRKKYDLGVKTDWTVLPIAYSQKPIFTQQPAAVNKVVVYAGGGQTWQNIEKMVETINTAKEGYTYLLLTHSPQVFAGISEPMKDKTTVKSVPSADIGQYYNQATYGFVLRNDHVVNRVACPTKLIEYLAYGIVPIVLSERIGDFPAMGYRYIRQADFIANEISPEVIKTIIEQNHDVYKAYGKKIKLGEERLKQLLVKIISTKHSIKKFETETVDRELELQEQHITILRYEYQIGVYKEKVTEYGKAVAYYQAQEKQYAEKSAANVTTNQAQLRLRRALSKLLTKIKAT